MPSKMNTQLYIYIILLMGHSMQAWVLCPKSQVTLCPFGDHSENLGFMTFSLTTHCI